MRTRTLVTKDASGAVISEETQGWWNSTITMSGLAPNPVYGIDGEVVATGGWCIVGEWNNPAVSNVLRCSASRWASLLAVELGVSAAQVIGGIATVLEKLEDERLAPPTPIPNPVDPTVEG